MISLSMIVKSEEKYLQDCLESVKGVVDEIIVVDTGSTDRTIEIAMSYAAKIHHFTWINDFAAARNFSLDKCTGDWILYLDADERLSAKSVNLLKSLTSKKENTAYYCQVCSVDEVNNRPSIMSYVRLFPNIKGLKFEGAIHEQIEFSLLNHKIATKNSGIEIIHIGYNLATGGLILKAQRNLGLLLSEYKKNNSSYYAFQLGQTYGIMQDKPEAVKYFQIALQDKFLKPEYKSTAYRYLSIDLADKQEWNKALELINESIKNDANQPLALLAASQIYVKLSRVKEAELFCEKAYEVNAKLSKSSGHSSQVILLSEKDILFHCLNIALSLQNNEMFNRFYKKLEKLSDSSAYLDIKKELKLFHILLNNKKLEKNNYTELTESLNDSNLNIFIALLDHYTNLECKIEVLQVIYNKYPLNFSVLNKFGLALAEAKKIDDALVLFEKSLEINPNDPSTVFYLISIYVQKNNLQKIIFLLEFAKNKYSNFPAVLDKLKLVEHKLNLR